MNDRATSIPTPRESALAFTEGSKAGWITSDLVAWTSEHLIVPDRFCTRDGNTIRVFEHGLGELSVDIAPSSTRSRRSRTTSRVPMLVATARDRVVHVLRMTARTGETSFVNAALYSGRVSRERDRDGVSVWQTYLSENDALSDQVLALFAADALTFPADYEHGITVCNACGVVSFRSGPGARNGCAYHPYSTLDGKPSESHMPRDHTRL